MEIRTLAAAERMKVADLLDGWRLAEGWTAGDRFRQQAEFDPTWHDENVFVALTQGRIVAALTIVPRHLKILGHVVPTGGVGNFYADPSVRRRGGATALRDRAGEAMRARGLELGVVFPGAPPATPEFFARRGWHAWGGQQTILRVDPAAPNRGGEEADDFELQSVGSEDARALQSVKSIHIAYAGSRSGTVVRDDALWKACLQLTPAPREEFWVARRGGLVVAYARASIVDDVLTITELGRFEDGAGALARLIASLLAPRENDSLIPEHSAGRVASEQLRAFAVLPTFDDIGLTVALEHRGIRSHPMDDAKASFRCVNLIGFASRLDVDLLPDEDGSAFLQRILPPDAMVFWPQIASSAHELTRSTTLTTPRERDRKMLERVEVQQSPIHGRGVFARQRLRKGQRIGRFEGVETTEDGTYVLWLIDDDGEEVGILGRNALRFLNHGDSPNAEFRDADLFALRSVQIGAEVLIDYGAGWE